VASEGVAEEARAGGFAAPAFAGVPLSNDDYGRLTLRHSTEAVKKHHERHKSSLRSPQLPASEKLYRKPHSRVTGDGILPGRRGTRVPQPNYTAAILATVQAVWRGRPMGPQLARCLAIIIWVLTPPVTWIAEWLEWRRRRRR
jgi:hypothetical protein